MALSVLCSEQGNSPSQTNCDWPWLFRPSLCFGQALTGLLVQKKNHMTCLFRLYDNWLTRHRISHGAHVLGPQLQSVAGTEQGVPDTKLHAVVAPSHSGALHAKAKTCLYEGWS